MSILPHVAAEIRGNGDGSLYPPDPAPGRFDPATLTIRNAAGTALGRVYGSAVLLGRQARESLDPQDRETVRLLDERAHATGRLWAAAPSLYDACRAFLAAWDADPADVPQMDAALAAARAAVAQAEGRAES